MGFTQCTLGSLVAYVVGSPGLFLVLVVNSEFYVVTRSFLATHTYALLPNFFMWTDADALD